MNKIKSISSNHSNMNAARYKLIFTGKIIEGSDIKEVKKKIALQFKIGEDKIERLFSGHPVLVRKNVDYMTARRFQMAFQKAGALCQMIKIKEEKPQKEQAHEDVAALTAKLEKQTFVLPIEIMHWNWGAFFLTWIWGLGNRVYISLLSIVPVIGLVIPLFLGWKGNEWAWKNKKWDSIEHFKKVQKKWAMGGIVLCLISSVAFIYPISLIVSRLSTYQKLLESGVYSATDLCRQNRSKIQTALNQAYNDGAITGDELDATSLETLVALEYLTEIPKCFSGGHYFIQDGTVHCSIHGP